MNGWMDEFNKIIDFDLYLGDVDNKCIIYNFVCLRVWYFVQTHHMGMVVKSIPILILVWIR